MANRAYGLIRSIVESHGGSMIYERKGYRHRAWVIRIGEKITTVEAGGNQSFPELDRLYVPRVPQPRHYYDYSNELVADAENQLLSILGISENRTEYFPDEQRKDLANLIERTKWKFAWTYARTYPHEYTTKALCSSEDHAWLIDCIEQFGIVSGSATPAASISTLKSASSGTWVSRDPRIWRNGLMSSTAPG